jgi:hypothetical protein
MEGNGEMYAATKDNPTENTNQTSSFCAVNASSTDQFTQAQFILRNNLSHSKIYRISIIASPRTMRMPAPPIFGLQSRMSLQTLVELKLIVQRLNDGVVRQTFDTIASFHGVITLASAHDVVHVADPRSAVVRVAVSVSPEFRGQDFTPAIANAAAESTSSSLAGFTPTFEFESGESGVTAGCAQLVGPVDGDSCCAGSERVNDSLEIRQAGGEDGEVEHDL